MSKLLSRRSLLVFGSAALSSLCQVSKQAISVREGLQRLQEAYPDFVSSIETNHIRWGDGFRMPVSVFPANRSMVDQVRLPDLAAQVTQRYPRARCAMPRSPEVDPGRVRYIPFFQRMYGSSRNQVMSNLEKVRWPTRQEGGTLEVSRVNGVAKHLSAIADELAALPTGFRKYFDNPGGGFRWREVAGTQRLSGHAFGFAIDVNLNYGDYWRRETEADDETEAALWPDSPRPENRIPFEIVEIFERHGFIWGGKWYHFDTPHFEYRPELLLT
jgi:peptidoglycan LD-endopeptidase CwlK